MNLRHDSDQSPRPAPRADATSRPPRGRNSLLGLILAVIGLAATTAGGWMAWRWSDARDPGLDLRLVAVVPFRAVGAEPDLAHLREGMMDLLAARLADPAGPRAADPRSVLAAWRGAAGDPAAELRPEDAMAIARSLGAAQLLLGEVTSLPDGVGLTASLHRVATGRADPPFRVEGSADSLPALVDRLVAGLFGEAAVGGRSLASLTTGSAPALRLYLDGQVAWRGGRHDDAHAHFARAVEIDTTFALSALMAARTAGWPLSRIVLAAPAAMDHAWRHRERLSDGERGVLVSLLGLAYPGPSSPATLLALRESQVGDRPDSPEAWFAWSDAMLNGGGGAGIPDTLAIRGAEAGFERVLALDPAFLPALDRLVESALLRGDTSTALGLAGRYLALDSASGRAIRFRELRSR